MKSTRRNFLRTGALALAAPALDAIGGPLGSAASAQTGPKEWRHGLSLFGDLKYPAGFQHFDYVNPKAPKGGAARLIAFGTFDNFNLVVAGVKGSLAAGIELLYDTLMASALDEVSTEYGLLAEAVSHPEDFSSVTYRLRANAKWHDGKPVTPEDVIFSFDAFKKHSPQLSAYYRHVTKAEKTGEREVTFTFDGPGNRELPQIVGQLNVLPKHWWEGTDAAGKQARHRRDHARAAARLRRLPAQGVHGRAARSSSSACRTIGARTSTSTSAATISTSCATNISATPPSRSKPSRPTTSTGAPRTAPRTGRPPTTSRPCKDKRVLLEEFPIRNVGRDAGLRLQHRAATSSRIRACAARSTSPSTSRR